MLKKIITHKLREIEKFKSKISLSELRSEAENQPIGQDFRSAISVPNQINLIAELKKKSPSAGVIRSDFDPVKIAKIYEENGASAISVLTDEKFFGGNIEYLEKTGKAVNLPLLRKDFVVDPCQIYEAKIAGASAILLIVAALPMERIREFIAIAKSLELASLVEVHDRLELSVALEVGAEIIGINNRNLKTFKTELETTFKLIEEIPSDRVVVSESGISSGKDIVKLVNAGVSAFLIGEALMRSQKIEAKIREFLLKSPANKKT